MAKKKKVIKYNKSNGEVAQRAIASEIVSPISGEEALEAGFRFREAYTKSAAAREALQPAELLRLSFDVTLAVNIALAAAPRLAELKEEIAKLPIDHSLIDQLDTYAHAVGYAQALYSVASVSQELQVVYTDALARRTTLRSDAANLATHGLVSQDKVLAIKGDVGYRNVGYELLALISILRGAGTRIQGRIATLPEDLDRAEEVATELLELTARKEQRQQGDVRATEDRLRAITLMVKAYNQARRAVHFLRWDYGDADKITPSIYTARSVKRRSPEFEVEVEVEGEVQGPGALPPPNASPVLPSATQGSSATTVAPVPQPGTTPNTG